MASRCHCPNSLYTSANACACLEHVDTTGGYRERGCLRQRTRSRAQRGDARHGTSRRQGGEAAGDGGGSEREQLLSGRETLCLEVDNWAAQTAMRRGRGVDIKWVAAIADSLSSIEAAESQVRRGHVIGQPD